MKNYDYDLFVFGAGSGGVRAARMAAASGARVAVAEERYLGGTCVNVGCVPKKLLVYAAHYAEDFEHAAGFGWNLGDRSHNWSVFRERKDTEIARLNQIYGRLLDDAGVTRIEGRAQIVEPNLVEVAGKRYSAENILIATGSWPRLPDIPGIEHAISSNEAFSLPELPERVIVVGGGYIAVEFAGIFNGLGAHTTLVHRGDLLLRSFDHDARTTLTQELPKKGIDLRLHEEVASITKTANGIQALLKSGESLDAGVILFATGRVPLSRELGLEHTDVQLAADGSVIVDEYSRTTDPHVFAIGDVTNRLNLTPMAIAEAMALVDTLYHGRPTEPDYSHVPTAVFSQPPVATVGLTEAEARKQRDSIDIYRSVFRSLKHSLSGSDEKTMMKLVVDANTDEVLGIHMVGADAGEMIQGFAVALRCGATKAQFDATVGVHPTSAEEFVTMRQKVEKSPDT